MLKKYKKVFIIILSFIVVISFILIRNNIAKEKATDLLVDTIIVDYNREISKLAVDKSQLTRFDEIYNAVNNHKYKSDEELKSYISELESIKQKLQVESKEIASDKYNQVVKTYERLPSTKRRKLSDTNIQRIEEYLNISYNSYNEGDYKNVIKCSNEIEYILSNLK